MTFERATKVMKGFFGHPEIKYSSWMYTKWLKDLPISTWELTHLCDDYSALYTYNGSEYYWNDAYDRWLQSMEKWIRITYSGQWRDTMTESVRDVLNGRVDHLIRYDISDPE